MKETEILQNLENLFTDLAIEIRYEKGDFTGGWFRYRDKQQIVVNKDLSDTQKIHILASELKAKFDLDHLYVVPALREVIEHAGNLE
jgi:hypothetical protein